MSSPESSPEPNKEDYFNEKGEYVHVVRLPSGGAIEVVYFDYQTDYYEPQEEPLEDLICPCCRQDAIQPGYERAVSNTHTRVEWSCLQCEWTGAGTYDNQILEGFEEILNKRWRELIEVGKRAEEAKAQIEEEKIKNFAEALEKDQILPEDF